MNYWKYRPRVSPMIGLGAGASALWVIAWQGYLTNTGFLSGLLLLEALAAVIWKYQQVFFLVLILVFIMAGTDVPMQGMWGAVRWLVLATGALAGMAIYLKHHAVSLQAFHWVALACVVAAATSAEFSSFPKQPLLKALSLFLLFLYGAFGARLALMDREQKFCAALLWSCEGLIYFAAVQYFILHREFFGNPNSLGAMMGIVAVPLMLWGVSVSVSATVQRRRTLALLLSMALLFTSYARAGIVAASASCILFCVLSRLYRTLIAGLAIALTIAAVVASVVPLPNSPSAATTFSSRFLFKGKEHSALFGSRRTVWDTTISSIELHPWFGTGFGTALSTYDTDVDQVGNFGSNTITTREHGNSYLALIEGVGLVGALPFVCLILLTIVNIGRVLERLRQTRNLFLPAVPIAFVLIAGLVHAMFEDWLFAVGYYICPFFWSLAFISLDFASRASREFAPSDFPPMHILHEDVVVSSGR